jgi:hypothetical protein
MVTPAPTPEPVDPREMRAERRRAAAERLGVIGMALAEAMLARFGDATNAGEPVDTGAVALEYSRVSHGVRQSLLLEARFDGAGADLAKAVTDERATRRAEQDQARRKRIGANTECVGAAVGAVIAAESKRSGDKARARGLRARLWENLQDPREEDDFADLPVSRLVARICGDLGVPVDWSLWEDEDWAVDEWRAGLAGSPYAAPGETPGPGAAPERTETPTHNETPRFRDPPPLPTAPEILCAAEARPQALRDAALARGPPG